MSVREPMTIEPGKETCEALQQLLTDLESNQSMPNRDELIAAIKAQMAAKNCSARRRT